MWLCLLCLASAATASRAQKVKVEYNKKQDFSGFKTYAWMKQTANDHPFMVAMDIRGEVDKQLQAKGSTKTTGNPDLLVNDYGALDGKLNVSYDALAPSTPCAPGLDGPWWDEGRPRRDWATAAARVLIDQGTLVIDLVERAA